MALRQTVWIDKSVQGVLVGRVLLYWLSAILYVGIGSACFQYNQNPDWTLSKHAQVLFGQIWPWLPTAILVLPLTIYDVVRMSNLFAGPIYRMRKHFDSLRQDIACPPLTFREDDYWRDLAAPINDMQGEILRLRSGIIELQKVSNQTSELMSNLTETPEDSQPYPIEEYSGEDENYFKSNQATEAQTLEPQATEIEIAGTATPISPEASRESEPDNEGTVAIAPIHAAQIPDVSHIPSA